MMFFRVFALSVLWKGVLCARADYTLTVRSRVTAQEGLCVLIPCEFTTENTTVTPESPRGYWFIEGTRIDGPAVASNDGNRAIYREARGRFTLVGDVSRRDCSLRVDDVTRWDEKTYYFKYEHSQSSSIKWLYHNFPLRVTVVDLQDKSTIHLPPALIEGEYVSVNCTAPGQCSGTPPSITWTVDLNSAYSTMNHSVNKANGTQSHISEITFQPSREDNGKELSCTATFSSVGASTTSRATLNVEYPPMTPAINVSITDREGRMRTSNATSVVVLEGSDCSLLCTADSNPLSTLTWMKGELILNESALFSKDLKLTRSNITSNDDGIYRCVAANKHGQTQSSVTVSVQYPPRNLKITTEDTMTEGHLSEIEENLTEKILEGSSIIMKCSVESSPPASLTWMKAEDRILGKFDMLNENTLTLKDVTPENDGQYLCVAENKHGTVNSSLFITVEYKPRLASSFSSSCQSVENTTMCMCVVEANPPPTIEWKINEITLPESFHCGSKQQAFSLHHAMKNRTLIMSISDSASLSITCIFSNKHGRGAQILMSPEASSTPIQGLSVGAIAGIVVAITLLLMLLVGVSLCITRKIRKKGNPGSGTMNEASNGAPVDSTYQELQRRQSDTYSELKRDGK